MAEFVVKSKVQAMVKELDMRLSGDALGVIDDRVQSALKKAAKRAEAESAVLANIAEMPEPDRAMATRLHEVIMEAGPDLWPKTWYGMPAYARDGKVVCFFQSAQKFNARYATLGFNDTANLDEGAMWPTSFALTELTAADVVKLMEHERVLGLAEMMNFPGVLYRVPSVLEKIEAAGDHPIDGDIDITVDFPDDTSAYDHVDIRRIDGAVAPNTDCRPIPARRHPGCAGPDAPLVP